MLAYANAKKALYSYILLFVTYLFFQIILERFV